MLKSVSVCMIINRPKYAYRVTPGTGPDTFGVPGTTFEANIPLFLGTNDPNRYLETHQISMVLVRNILLLGIKNKFHLKLF